ncbi:peptidyl-tRNA hydrolase, PTH1 family [Nannocystis exedens]|uniref:Peptidyl-tRNA hydrolase n=1 Tax=Nannocystis exedens TaxID=54 RepID=A0A1I2FZF8_9BACT|nr:aminoacyl-tRNA hydrolase [Nannocystis exedens]PCC74560.1 peptidyl-tRNA hydrolase [Nannocystis exedens]SFF10303.1 peptidyl-tRNA hydrolase, PTH1 family [Nannocystis exedens]
MADQAPWLLVGLGNPGARYARTRHNIGFMAVDAWCDKATSSPSWSEKWKAQVATLGTGSSRVVALKPQTFMNRSGQSVVPAAQFLRVPPAQILVVHDEVDFQLGRLAVKKGGGHGGHNGLRDILQLLGSGDFLRIRLGIGRPVHGEVADHVLSDFRPDEGPVVDDLLERAVAAITCVTRDGVVTAMNKFNTT